MPNSVPNAALQRLPDSLRREMGPANAASYDRIYAAITASPTLTATLDQHAAAKARPHAATRSSAVASARLVPSRMRAVSSRTRSIARRIAQSASLRQSAHRL